MMFFKMTLEKRYAQVNGLLCARFADMHKKSEYFVHNTIYAQDSYECCANEIND